MTVARDETGNAGHETCQPWGRRDVLALLTLVVLGALLPALVAAASGLVDVPRNDDWSYRAITMNLYQTGSLRMDGASQTFAIGQVFATIPLLWLMGGNDAAFFVAGTGFSVLAVIAAYGLAREFLGRSDAVLVTVVLLVAPGYLAYSSSFMTDVPALALTLWCLWFGVKAVQENATNVRWFLAAAIAGALAFSIRQFALAAPMAVAVAAVFAAPRHPRAWALAAIAIALPFGAALLQSSLGGQVGATPVLPGGLDRLAAAVASSGLFLLPISLRSLHLRVGIGGWAPMGIGIAGAVVIAVAAVVAGDLSITLGDLVSPWGAPGLGSNAGGRPLILGPIGWLVLQLLSLAGVLFTIEAILRSVLAVWRSRNEGRPGGIPGRRGLVLVIAFVATTVGGLLAYSVLWAFFDRYLWPLVVPMGILLLHPAVRSRAGDPVSAGGDGRFRDGFLAVAATVFLGAVAMAYALNSFAFDAARWRAGGLLVSLGHSAQQVDAGYEWVGTYAPGPALMRDRQVRPLDGLTWYGSIWPNFRRCAIVAGSTLDVDGFTPVIAGEATSYRMFLIAGADVPLFLYRSQAEGCVRSAGDRQGGLAGG